MKLSGSGRVLCSLRRAVGRLRPWRPGTITTPVAGPAVHEQWYLSRYPDVARAGLRGATHYQRFGFLEGRLPAPPQELLTRYPACLPALELLLWQGYASEALPMLQELYQDAAQPVAVRVRASLGLADWYHFRGETQAALTLLVKVRALASEQQLSPPSVLLSALWRLAGLHNKSDLVRELAQYSASLSASDRALISAGLAALYAAHNLSPLPRVGTFRALAEHNIKHALPAAPVADLAQPEISVIMPAFNAADTITVALAGLSAQSFQAIEVIVVDDASTDNTVQVVHDWQVREPRLRLLRQAVNQGAYAARNLGLQHARGRYITVHDADDWSHPQKLTRQWQALQDEPKAAYSVSFWLRVTSNLQPIGGWRLSEPLLQRNVSSALFPRTILTECGPWQSVRVGADTELLARARQFGPGIDVLPQVPLSLSLVQPGALTRQSVTHIATRHYGLRRLYHEGWGWQHRVAAQPAEPPPVHGNLVKPPYQTAKFDVVVVADFSRSDLTLKEALAGIAGQTIGLLHWPAGPHRAGHPVADDWWTLLARQTGCFLPPGTTVQAAAVWIGQGVGWQRPPDKVARVFLPTPSDIRFLHPREVVAATPGISAAMVRTVLAAGAGMPGLAEVFDEPYYLKHNPDVAAACRQGRTKAFTHYLHHGQREGRRGYPLYARELETALWQQSAAQLTKPTKPAAYPAYQTLHKLALSVQSAAFERTYACWALARWWASYGQWQDCAAWLHQHAQQPAQLFVPGHRGPWLLQISCWLHGWKPLQPQNSEPSTDQHTAGELLAQAWQEPFEPTRQPQSMTIDGQLAQVTAAAQGLWPATNPLAPLARIWANAGVPVNLVLPPANKRNWQFADLSHYVQARPAPLRHSRWWSRLQWQRRRRTPLVSVIVPCHNAANTIHVALGSLLAQSWPRLEVIVVDDASTDDSGDRVKQWQTTFQQHAVKLTLLTHAHNQGPYAARNTGLAASRGAFITTHDADDWSHPDKISLQARALMQQPTLQATVSHWVRTTDSLVFGHWRPESSWVYRNVSSLMFRRRVHRHLGYWDRVRCDGDTEFYYRILAAYSGHIPGNVIQEVLPGVPLAFARWQPNTLTQQADTHVRSSCGGARHDYQQAAQAWHQQARQDGRLPRALYLSQDPAQRPFTAPPGFWQPSLTVHVNNVLHPQWYRQQYPDVRQAAVDPRAHYLRWGQTEGRIPGPRPAPYQQTCFQGQPWQAAAPVLMVFGHQVSRHRFGAERSLLDTLAIWHTLPMNVVVVLPRIEPDYLAQVRQWAQQVHLQPYTWWHAERPLCPQVLAACEQLLARYQPRVVYANTLTLWEPLLAARRQHIPAWLHVRELPQADPTLCQQLGADAADIKRHVLTLANGVIANSQAVAQFLQPEVTATLIPNHIDLATYQAIPDLVWNGQGRLRVALISSNVAKKGLADLLHIARQAERSQLPVDFLVYGPPTATLTALTEQGLPSNLRVKGYAHDLPAVLRHTEVVLNLSHFQESFGRTVLEAMAAGRVVVAYDWGAIPELVTPGTGYTVPFCDTRAVLDTLAALACQPEHLNQLGQAARDRAQAYDSNVVARQWAAWFQALT